jgi:hypothetical protein
VVQVRNPVEMVALIGLFLLLSLLTIVFRDLYLLQHIASGGLPHSKVDLDDLFCSQLPACLRIIGPTIETLSGFTLVEVSRWLDLLPARYQPELVSTSFKEGLLLVFGSVFARVLPLVAVLLYVLMVCRRFIVRALVMTAVFVAFVGWARSNPLFQEQYMVLNDWWATGFLFGLLIYFDSREEWRFFEIAALVVFGQLIFENLGIVTAVGAVIAYLHSSPEQPVMKPWRTAFQRLVLLGAVSLTALTVTYLFLKSVVPAPGVLSSDIGFLDHIKNAWLTYGRDNWNDAYDIFENFLELMAYPVLSGLIIAGTSWALERIVRQRPAPATLVRLRRNSLAGGGVFLGFMITVVIGFFQSGLYYEMGRQLVPLACIIIPVAYKSVELLIFKRM